MRIPTGSAFAGRTSWLSRRPRWWLHPWSAGLDCAGTPVATAAGPGDTAVILQVSGRPRIGRPACGMSRETQPKILSDLDTPL